MKQEHIGMAFFLVFLCEIFLMKKIFLLNIGIVFPLMLLAQNEIGPDGDKLLMVLLVLFLAILLLIISTQKNKPKNNKSSNWLLLEKGLKISLEKDTLYYPDTLKLEIINTRNHDVDLDNPLLIFDNFWMKRKFKIKGVGNLMLYPLYLEKGKTHTLEIDLNRFYIHDKSLKKFPKAKVIVSDIKGRKLGSKSVFLRKTLMRY